jgi:predicted ATPase/class 3 adenylate cyclase
LGDLEVVGRAGPIRIGGRRRRALVAYLLVNAGVRVSIDFICEAVWGADQPNGAAATVRTYVSQLRKLDVSGRGLMIESDVYGYRLVLDRGDLDATRFEDEVASAHQLDDLDERLRLLDAALGLWRGPPLVEFADAGWAAIEARRLATIRDRATVERFDVLLQQGRHDDCLVELEAAVTRSPFDEHLAAQLALARYRCGAVADALRGLGALRRRLGEELGLSPGPEVVDLERRMLDRDRELHSGGSTAPGALRLPTGTVTFLFTDTEGSTGLLGELGNAAYAAVLATQRRHIADAVHVHGGVVFGMEGDAVFSAFESATSAVDAAIDAQRRLAAEMWPVPVRTRIGLHTGEALLVGDDYVGTTVHCAARVTAAAHGGQVIASDACRSLASSASWIDLGRHRLKDIARPQRLHQVDTGDDATFPPLPTADNVPTNLPESLDTFVGREDERRSLDEELDRSRLVTLVGPGGVGKTRLAIETARSVRARYPGGVHLVELARVSAGGSVAAAVAQTLVEAGARGPDLSAIVANAVGEDATLVVLDNCEHVIEQAARVAGELLTECPSITLLSTSREPLGTRGERVHPVRPLQTVGEHGSSAAEQLFTARAEAATGRPIRPDEEGLVRTICSELDGLPLAIELAASRATSLAVIDIARRLDDRFSLFRSTRPDEDRHRTLRAVVDWSYELLTPIDRALFNRLCVFGDSFTLEAAEAVVADDLVPVDYVLEGLSRLVDKSVVHIVATERGTRYRLLDTLRSYGRARLVEAGTSDDAEGRFLDWAMALTAQLEADMRTERQDTSLAAVLVHRGNLRSAVERQVAAERHLDALRIVASAPVDVPAERVRLIDELIPRVRDDDDADIIGRAHLAAANLEFERGEFASGRSHARSAAGIYEGLGDDRSVAWAWFLQTFGTWGTGDLSAARVAVENARRRFSELGDPVGYANALWASILLAPDLDEADRMGREAESRLRAIDSPFALAHCLEARALVALQLDRPGEARTHLTEALATFASTATEGCVAHCLEAIAASIVNEREPGLLGVTAELLGAADSLRATSGHRHRPWELEGQRAAMTVLHRSMDAKALEDAVERGRGHNLRSAIQLVHHALDVAT